MLGVSDTVICRSFLATLSGRAAEWFRKLEPPSISDFSQLVDKFIQRFATSKDKKRYFTHLSSIKKQAGEPLSRFLH